MPAERDSAPASAQHFSVQALPGSVQHLQPESRGRTWGVCTSHSLARCSVFTTSPSLRAHAPQQHTFSDFTVGIMQDFQFDSIGGAMHNAVG